MLSKMYYCPYCEKITKHIEKNAKEIFTDNGKFWERFGYILDITGTTRVSK